MVLTSRYVVTIVVVEVHLQFITAWYQINLNDPVGLAIPGSNQPLTYSQRASSRLVWGLTLKGVFTFRANNGQRIIAPKNPNNEPSDKLTGDENRTVSTFNHRFSQRLRGLLSEKVERITMMTMLKTTALIKRDTISDQKIRQLSVRLERGFGGGASVSAGVVCQTDTSGCSSVFSE
jgi:hypothetical protein